jgi:predicted nuclease with TOPRIM domain
MGGSMKESLAILIFAGMLLSNVAYAGLCDTKPEAESKTNTLPVKYHNLKKENEILQSELTIYQKEKEAVKKEIAELESRLSQLEETKAQLTKKLESYPSKWELLSKIHELEEKLGR